MALKAGCELEWLIYTRTSKYVANDPPDGAFATGAQVGVTHTVTSKFHDEINSFVFVYTKYGDPIVIMDFRRAIKKALCGPPTPPPTLMIAAE